MKNIKKALGISVFISFLVWSIIALYLFFIKAIDYPREFPLEKLGQAGDFFNVATSLTSLITVIIVYSAYKLQRKELKDMTRELKNQVQTAKKEEATNRAIKLFDEYLLINEQIIKSSEEQKSSTDYRKIKQKYINLIRFSRKIISMKKNGLGDQIDFESLMKNLEEINFYKHFDIAIDNIIKICDELKKDHDKHTKFEKLGLTIDNLFDDLKITFPKSNVSEINVRCSYVPVTMQKPKQAAVVNRR